VLTWHVHGSYLWYLSHMRHELYLPVTPDRRPGYGGRAGARAWPPNVREVAIEDVPDLQVDAVLYQSHQHWAHDRVELLSAHQRAVPQIYLEHDPPRASPTDTRHPVDDPDVLVVHVTPFNQLMWDCGATPTTVVEHGVAVPGDACWTGGLARGIVVANGLKARGRRLGADIFTAVRAVVPLDLVGIDSEHLGGLGEVPPPDLPRFLAPYRFYFHPVRYTSLGLALCEAMAVGLPIVGLATTELATVVTDGVNGFVDTDVTRLADCMQLLLDDVGLARRLGGAAAQTARERFAIGRFVRDWEAVLGEVCGRVGYIGRLPSTTGVPAR
jgi:Glycosyl transferases group 1